MFTEFKTTNRSSEIIREGFEYTGIASPGTFKLIVCMCPREEDDYGEELLSVEGSVKSLEESEMRLRQISEVLHPILLGNLD